MYTSQLRVKITGKFRTEAFLIISDSDRKWKVLPTECCCKENMATAKTVLPEESELTVQELNVSWPVLQTASVYIGKACEWYNNVSCNFIQ